MAGLVKRWKTSDNNDLNQVVASSGFSENKGLGGVLSLAGSQNLVLVLDFRIRSPHLESKTDSGFHIPDSRY